MDPQCLLNYADVLATAVDNGDVRANLGDSITGEGLDSDVAQWGTDGFVSRPDDPDANGAAQAMYLVDGLEKRIVGTRDQRWADKAGALAPGDRAIIGNCDARVFVKRKANAVSIYTLGPDGDPLVFEVNGSKSQASLLVGGSGGTALIQAKPGQIVLGVDGGGSIVIDKQGVHIFGPYFAANTGGGNLGATPAGQPPPPGIGSVLRGLAGQTGVASKSWTVAE